MDEGSRAVLTSYGQMWNCEFYIWIIECMIGSNFNLYIYFLIMSFCFLSILYFRGSGVGGLFVFTRNFVYIWTLLWTHLQLLVRMIFFLWLQSKSMKWKSQYFMLTLCVHLSVIFFYFKSLWNFVYIWTLLWTHSLLTILPLHIWDFVSSSRAHNYNQVEAILQVI